MKRENEFLKQEICIDSIQLYPDSEEIFYSDKDNEDEQPKIKLALIKTENNPNFKSRGLQIKFIFPRDCFHKETPKYNEVPIKDWDILGGFYLSKEDALELLEILKDYLDII